MIELDITGSIESNILTNADASKIEEILQTKITEELTLEMAKHIDKLSFVDIDMNPQTGNFDYTASLVLCSKQQIISSNDIMAQKLMGYGLSEDEIIDVLSTSQENMNGF